MLPLFVIGLGVVVILATRSQQSQAAAPPKPPEPGPALPASQGDAMGLSGGAEGLSGGTQSAGALAAILAQIASGRPGENPNAPKPVEWAVLAADQVWHTTSYGYSQIMSILQTYTSHNALFHKNDDGTSMASAYEKRRIDDTDPSAADRYRTSTYGGDVALIDKGDFDKLKAQERVDLLTTFFVPPSKLGEWVGPDAKTSRTYVIVARPTA